MASSSSACSDTAPPRVLAMAKDKGNADDDDAALERGLARDVLELHRAGHRERALARAEALVLELGDSALAFNLLGYLHREAAVRPSEQPGPATEAKAAAEKHLSSAREALSAAMGLAPKSVDIAVFLGNVMVDSEMYVEAEHQLFRATSIEAEDRLIDVAASHSVLYDDEPYANDPDPKPSPKKEENEKGYTTWLEWRNAHFFYGRNLELVKERIVRKSVMAVVDAIREKGVDAALLQRAAAIAKRFQYSGRAKILPGYTQMEQSHSLAASAADRRQCLRRALEIAKAAVIFYPRSLVIALFHAQLLFVLGDHAAAESECRRALDVDDPADPNEDDIPPGSVEGEEYADRVSSVKKQLRGLLLVKDYWCSMATERATFLQVRADALREHYGKIDRSVAVEISDAQRFAKKHGHLRSFWICPNCHGEEVFFGCGLFLEHMCQNHLEVTLQEMRSSVFFEEFLPELDDDESGGDVPIDEITLCPDSGGHDLFRLNEMKDLFVCLPHFPSCGIEARALMGTQVVKCRKGNEILQEMKEKLKIPPGEVLSNQARLDIQDLWIELSKTSLLDYHKVILPLARSFQWWKLKKCMAQDAYIAGRNIEKADIDAIFVNVADDQSTEEMASISGYLKSVGVLDKYKCDEDLFFLNVVIQALWNLRYFRDECLSRSSTHIFQSACDDPYICIADNLFGIISAWEKNEYDRTASLLMAMKTALYKIKDRNLCNKVRKENASENVAIILKGLHMSDITHFDSSHISEGQKLNPISSTDCICQAHDLFGLTFHVQISCRCAKLFDEKEYSTFFHELNVGSPETIKIKSLSELPVLSEEQLCCKDTCKQCGSLKHADHFLSNTPHFFSVVFNWLGDGENQNALSELLIGITCPVDINLLYEGVQSTAKYILSSMVIDTAGGNNGLFGIEKTLDDTHKLGEIGYADGSYVCFSRYQDRWLIYDVRTVKAVGSWPELLDRYRGCKLQPEVLFFEIIK